MTTITGNYRDGPASAVARTSLSYLKRGEKGEAGQRSGLQASVWSFHEEKKKRQVLWLLGENVHGKKGSSTSSLRSSISEL